MVFFGLYFSYIDWGNIRDGEFSTVRMVINTNGGPVLRMTEISSYVQWVLARLTRSLYHNPFLITFPPFLLGQLQDPNGHTIARIRSVTPTKYNIGDVYRELHYFRTAGAGIVVSLLWVMIHPCLELAPGCRPLRGTPTSRNTARRGPEPASENHSVLLTNSYPVLIQMNPPFMDTVTVTAMLYLFATAYSV